VCHIVSLSQFTWENDSLDRPKIALSFPSFAFGQVRCPLRRDRRFGSMPDDRDDIPHIALTEAAGRLADEPTAFIVFRRGDFSVELFAPHGTDTQQPHDQDEAYIIASGSGMFCRGEERVPFRQGDFLFVAAGVPHRFEEFTDDFQTWVIFFGPKGGCGG
jgi:mannose-6-phosphate isomerase-like protein (cupin superfamily)